MRFEFYLVIFSHVSGRAQEAKCCITASHGSMIAAETQTEAALRDSILSFVGTSKVHILQFGKIDRNLIHSLRKNFTNHACMT